MKQEGKVWIDHNGQNVPVQYVPDHDKKKERIAQKYLKKAIDLNMRLEQLKQEAFADLDRFYEDMLRENNLSAEDRKGNFTLTSFDKSIKIEVKVQDRIEFDDRITLAQLKINEFLQEKTKDSDLDLIEIVNNAFQTNKGRLDTKRVLSLFGYKIKHPLWLEAMELLKQSIDRNNSKRYLSISERNENGVYVQIQLNFASI